MGESVPAQKIIYSRGISLLGGSPVPLMHFQVRLGGCVETRGLVDTGAQRSFIHESLVPKLWRHWIDSTRRYQLTAIGESSSLLSLGTISLSLSTERTLFKKITLVVVP